MTAPASFHCSQPSHESRKPHEYYTFVDYATQGYAALVATLILCFHNGTVPRWPWLVAVHLAILALVHLLIRGHARCQRGQTFNKAAQSSNLRYAGDAPGQPGMILDFVRHFYPVLLYTWFFCETGWLNRMFFRDYLDPVVIRWDQALFGFQPSVWFMEKLPYLAVSELFYASYFSYYLMIVGVGVTLFLRNRRHFSHYVAVVSFVFYVCYFLYIFLPVIGPRVFFREIPGYTLPADAQQLAFDGPAGERRTPFRRQDKGVDRAETKSGAPAPERAPTDYPTSVTYGPFYQIVRWIYRVFEAPGAAIPSSHVAVAVCTVFFSFLYLRRIRYVHLAAAVLLCLSTIYCRYHYVVDVLAGLATAALLIPVANWLYFKFERRDA